MAVYPAGAKTFASHREVRELFYAAHINDLQDEVAAMQSTIGLVPQIAAATSPAPRVFDSLAQRMDFMTPTFLVEAEVAAPYTFDSDAQRIVFDTVSTAYRYVRGGAAATSTFTLPFEGSYALSVAAWGRSALDGVTALDITCERTVTGYHVGRGERLIQGPHRLNYERVNLPVGQRPMGAGWWAGGGGPHPSQTWFRLIDTDRALSGATVRTETNSLARLEGNVLAGQPVGLSVTDLVIAPADAVTISVALSGVHPPAIRLAAYSLDAASVMP